jgi:hypothetical protein
MAYNTRTNNAAEMPDQECIPAGPACIFHAGYRVIPRSGD